MSATHYKKPHVDIFICIEMARERKAGHQKKTPGIWVGISRLDFEMHVDYCEMLC